jgi:hypothetical protein
MLNGKVLLDIEYINWELAQDLPCALLNEVIPVPSQKGGNLVVKISEKQDVPTHIAHNFNFNFEPFLPTLRPSLLLPPQGN